MFFKWLFHNCVKKIGIIVLILQIWRHNQNYNYKMRKFLLLVAVACVSSAMAQLTTREAAPNSYKLGAYPQAGDLSLMFSVFNITNFDSDDDAVSDFASVNSLGRGDLITAKYYWTDQVAFRVGIKLQREVSEKTSFDSDTSSELFTKDPDNLSPLQGAGTVESSNKDVIRDWAVKLGIEKHFNSSNFFDVYAGADLYLGLGKEKFVRNTTTQNGTVAVAPVGGVGGNGDGFSTVSNLTSSRSFTKLGVLPFIGVQMFVLDLPVSIGVEYGWDALWKFGGLYKNEIEIKQESANTADANGFVTFSENSVSGTYYSTGSPADANSVAGTAGQNGSAGSSVLNTNQNVKILLNIYFGRGGSSSSDVVIE